MSDGHARSSSATTKSQKQKGESESQKQKGESESQKQIEESSSKLGKLNLISKSQKPKKELQSRKPKKGKQKKKESESQKRRNPYSQKPDLIYPPPPIPLDSDDSDNYDNNDPNNHWKKTGPGSYFLPNPQRFYSEDTTQFSNTPSPPRLTEYDNLGFQILSPRSPRPCEICYSDDHWYLSCPYKFSLPPEAIPRINSDFCSIFCTCGQNFTKDGPCPEWCTCRKYVIENLVLERNRHCLSNLPTLEEIDEIMRGQSIP